MSRKKTTERYETLEDALSAALGAHQSLEPQEKLTHAMLGRYASHLGTRETMSAEDAAIAGSCYWQLNVTRTRVLAGPSPITSSPADLAAQRAEERKTIIAAYNEATAIHAQEDTPDADQP